MGTEVSTDVVKDDLNEMVSAGLPTNTPVAPTHGVATIALSMAMKFHDINTVQEGALYQQYKLEGKNMRGLHLDDVLETAAKLEAWLLGSSQRIAKLIVDAVATMPEDDEAEGDVEEQAESSKERGDSEPLA